MPDVKDVSLILFASRRGKTVSFESLVENILLISVKNNVVSKSLGLARNVIYSYDMRCNLIYTVWVVRCSRIKIGTTMIHT